MLWVVHFPSEEQTDRQIGGTMEGRIRLLLEVIRKIKEDAGEDFPIIIRMSGDEILEDGNHLNDMMYAARKFSEAGAGCLGAVSETHATCVINPMLGEEKEMELIKAETPKKVLSSMAGS